jgi:hypothetical protein
MEQRASLAGVDLDMVSAPGRGTEVHVRFESVPAEVETR